jgi:3-oxoadipate enol-lactonase
MKGTIRHAIARHEAAAFAPPLLDALEHLGDQNPQLAHFILDDCVGEVMGNAVLGYREWAMLTLAALVAIGDAGDQLDVYVQAALGQGATEDEVLDVVNLACGYIGAPRAVNATRNLARRLSINRSGLQPFRGEVMVDIGDHETMVLDTGGDGVPILLIHVLGLDHRFWRAVVPQLAQRGRVIAYDLRGHGRARGAPLTTSLEQLGEDARNLLDELGVKVADIYGSSYGGAVAQNLALAFPDRVRSLALLGTAARWPRKLLEARAAAAETQGMDAQVAPSLTRWFLPETIAEDRWPVRYARACVRRAQVTEWAAAWRAMSKLDLLDQLPNLKRPTLVLSGVQDCSTPPEVMRPIAEKLPHAEFVPIDPGSHLMALEQPSTVTEALIAFRRRIQHSPSSP